MPPNCATLEAMALAASWIASVVVSATYAVAEAILQSSALDTGDRFLWHLENSCSHQRRALDVREEATEARKVAAEESKALRAESTTLLSVGSLEKPSLSEGRTEDDPEGSYRGIHQGGLEELHALLVQAEEAGGRPVGIFASSRAHPLLFYEGHEKFRRETQQKIPHSWVKWLLGPKWRAGQAQSPGGLPS